MLRARFTLKFTNISTVEVGAYYGPKKTCFLSTILGKHSLYKAEYIIILIKLIIYYISGIKNTSLSERATS